MSDLTVNDLVARTQRWLLGMHGQPLNRVKTAVALDDLEIEFDMPPEVLSDGTWVGIGNEIVYIWKVQVGPKRLEVSRGQMGTEATAHPVGEVIESASRFPRGAIIDALQEEIRSWPDTVYQVKARPFTLGAQDHVLDIGRDVYAVIGALRSPVSGLTAGRWTPLRYRFDPLMPKDVFPSGNVLTITDGLTSVRASQVRVLCALPFDVDDMAGTLLLEDDLGLAPSMFDIPPMGAAGRLLQTRELQRTDTEAMQESRLAAEVPATFETQTATALRLGTARRLGQEANRLRSKYGNTG